MSGTRCGATAPFYVYHCPHQRAGSRVYPNRQLNDKAATHAAFLSFYVNQPVIVQVAHDIRITLNPSC